MRGSNYVFGCVAHSLSGRPSISSTCDLVIVCRYVVKNVLASPQLLHRCGYCGKAASTIVGRVEAAIGSTRLHADTLDRLCTFFEVQPGALMEWMPGKRRRNGAAS